MIVSDGCHLSKRVCLLNHIRHCSCLVLGALLSLVLLALPLSASADWLPFIVHFDKDDYGSGFTNWRIDSDRSWTFFANQKALLVFNGITWSRYELNNHSEVRGVKVSDDGRIVYVGGENEYGYFDVSPSGTLRYHCLSDMVDQKYRHLGNIWDFYEFDGTLYMRGDNYILTKQGDHYSLVVSAENLYASAMLDGALYVATDQGLSVLMGRKLNKVDGCDILKGKRINAIIPFGKGLLISTASNGLFYYDGRMATAFATPADDLLKEGVICCLAIRLNKLAVGTIHKGLVLIDLDGKTYEQFGESQGLQSNTVQSVGFDGQGNVWCGLDYGIDYILLNYPFTYLYRSPDSYGIGYASLLCGDYLYLGTDRGLYWTTYPISFSGGKADLRRVTGVPSSPAWALHRIGGDIFCLHDKGVYLIHGSKATPVTNIMGAWSCQAVKGHKDMLYIGVYGGVYVVKKINGKWTSLGKIRGIGDSGRFMEQRDARTLLIFNPNIGQVTTYHLDPSLMRVLSSRVSKARYNDPRNIPDFQYSNGWDVTGPPTYVSKTKLIIPYTNGYLLMDRLKAEREPVKVSIYNMFISYPKDSLVYTANFAGLKNCPRIKYSLNSVRFEFGATPRLVGTSVRYQYRLNGDSWSSLCTGTTKEYSSLRAGHYTFEVRCVANDGRKSTDKVEFLILPPWYLSWWAYVIYFIIILGVLWWLYALENRRVRKKEQAAIVEKAKEVDQMKVEIDKLEKDKLDLDLKHKSQEVANLVANVARKNEILSGIKEDIKRIITRMGIDTPAETKRQLTTVNGKIASNMEGDELFKRFEEQFDLVNNNLISKLRERYPSLNQNELMMCAYLKMNLSTKEIAPLLNMSVRGVETLRYRLRKKLSLEREDNLTEFLNHLK